MTGLMALLLTGTPAAHAAFSQRRKTLLNALSHGLPLEKPSIFWLISGLIYFFFQCRVKQLNNYYYDAVLKNFTILVKKHYTDDYAYNHVSIDNAKFFEQFKKSDGSIKEIFENRILFKFADIKDGDSFLDCGCGPGNNIKEIKKQLPKSWITAFDLSPNVIKFINDYFKQQHVEAFVGSVLDLDVFKKIPDRSIEHVFFANMLSTVFLDSVEKTKEIRQEIISQAIRIAKKNVILNEFLLPTRIYIEQKYRAAFDEDYSPYFESARDQGDLLLGKHLYVFHKNV